jgi:NADH dehydrogenase
MIFGRGDHMLEHLSRALHTFPVFLNLGRLPVRPLAVADVVRVLVAALVDGRLARRTVPLLGPAELLLPDAVEVVAEATGRHRPLVPAPVGAWYVPLAWLTEQVMRVPMLSVAQVRILREGIAPVLAPDELPPDLVPTTPYDLTSVRAGLPEPGGFTRADLRFCRPATA